MRPTLSPVTGCGIIRPTMLSSPTGPRSQPATSVGGAMSGGSGGFSGSGGGALSGEQPR